MDKAKKLLETREESCERGRKGEREKSEMMKMH